MSAPSLRSQGQNKVHPGASELLELADRRVSSPRGKSSPSSMMASHHIDGAPSQIPPAYIIFVNTI